MRGHRFRALLSPRSRRVGAAAAIALTLGGGLLASPAGALITSPVSGATVSGGAITVHESVTPTGLAPTTPATGADATNSCGSTTGTPPVFTPNANSNKPGATNFTVYNKTLSINATPSTANSPVFRTTEVYPPSTYTGPLPSGGHDFTWDSSRYPNGNYFLKTTTQNRNTTLPGTCALAAAVAQSDNYPVTLKNVGVIDMVSGAGAANVNATVSARLVSPINGAPEAITGQSVTVMKTRCYNLLGLIISCTGNTAVGGTTPVGGSVPPATGGNAAGGQQVAPAAPKAATALPSLAGFTLYTNGVTGYAPGINPGESVVRPNRITLTTADSAGVMTPRVVDCKSVFYKVALFAAIDPTITDTFDGFSGCVNANGTGVVMDSSVVNEGHAPASLTFTIGSHSAVGVIDRATGVATAVVDTDDIGVNPNVPLTVTSSDDGFLAPGVTVQNIPFKSGTKTGYSGDTTAFWNEPFTVTATVLGDPSHAVVPEGTVTFKLGNGTPQSAPVDPDTGVATATLIASDAPAPGQQIVATYDGTDNYNASSISTPFVTTPRPTTLVYSGPTTGNYNDTVTYSAKLTDDRTGDNIAVDANDAPLPGHPVAFKLGTSDAAIATTDANGVATVTVPIKSKVGTYELTSDYFATDTTRYAASGDSDTFFVDYQYKFTDTLIGNGDSVLLNPDTQQVGFEQANGRRSRIANRSFQLSLYLPTVIGYPDTSTGPLPELPQEWTILNLPRLGDLFGLVANPPALPAVPAVNPTVPSLPELPDPGTLPVELPMMSSSNARSASANNSGGLVLPNLGGGPTGTPAQTGNITIGELINSVAGSDIPVSLSACELLSGSTCERRFIIAATTRNPGPDVVGVFDVKTGLFASLVLDTPGAKPAELLASLGSCIDDLPLCIALPAPPSGLPSLSPPTLPDPTGLLDAITNLVAALQGLPDEVSAPTPPPVPMSSTATPSPALPTTSLLPGQGVSLATLVPTYWLG